MAKMYPNTHKIEVTAEELFKIDNEARRIERERVLKIVEKTREKIINASSQPNSFDKILEEMVDEMEGD